LTFQEPDPEPSTDGACSKHAPVGEFAGDTHGPPRRRAIDPMLGEQRHATTRARVANRAFAI